MFKIAKSGPNRVDIELRGTIDAEAMRNGLDALFTASEEVEKGKMLYTIPEFAMPTPKAIAIEMGYIPKMFGLLKKFDRCAVLTDAVWLQKAAELEGAVIPGIEIKSFGLTEVDAAEAWLGQ